MDEKCANIDAEGKYDFGALRRFGEFALRLTDLFPDAEVERINTSKGVRSIMLNIDGKTAVRDLLSEYPNAFHVLASHGMCQECKDNPPPVPLEHFAQKHCDGDLKNLIEQLEATIHHDNSPNS